jgi:NRPS condensation-like uncharacterized protein
MGKTEETETGIFRDLKRPTVTFSKDEHKRIKQYCLDNDITINDYLRQSALYCLENKIEFE